MSNSNADLDRFRADSSEPPSFRDRGAAVPFTTPFLLNARIRASHSGRGREIVIINPSGGRGVLVLPWSTVPEICSPTLFDRHLWESLAEASDISPIGIRHQAQKLAAQGLAGRRAAVVAQDAQRREQASQRLMRSLLIESLINATESAEEKTGQTASAPDALFAKRAERSVARAAIMAGLPPAEFAADLDALAIALSGAAPEIPGADARLRKMLDSLARMNDGIARWAEGENPESSHVMATKFIQDTAQQTLECAKLALSTTDTLVAGFGRLLPHWKTEKDKVLERARAPDWIMDGWQTPMALWETAGPDERPAAVWELALIAPILPREAKAWMGSVTDWRETPRRITQVVRDRADWRSGSVLEMVARNEGLIGSAISYENQVLPMRLPRGQNSYGQVELERISRKTILRPKNSRSGDDPKDKTKGQDDAGATPDAGPLEPFRGLGEILVSLNDAKLTKIVAVVDRLSHPQIRHYMIGPSLPRLKRLRPARPASLKRLLFLPLSGALTDPLNWRREDGRIPRSAIGPLMEALEPTLKLEIDRLARQMQNAKLEDPKLVDQTGRPLWRLAAEASARLQPGPSWRLAGLNDQDFDAIISLAGGLWRNAGPLWDGMQRIGGDCPPEILRAAVVGPANEGRQVFAAALDALLLRTARPSVFASLLKDKPLPNSGVIEDVLNKWVGATLNELAEEDFESGAQLAEGVRSVLEAMENLPRFTSKVDAKTLVAHRRALDQFCRVTYREIVVVHVIQALSEMKPNETEVLTEIELMARIARSLEDTGRRMGSAQSYQALQGEFRTKMAELQQDDAQQSVSAMEIARIGEILIGQEVAESFLEPARRQRLRAQ